MRSSSMRSQRPLIPNREVEIQSSNRQKNYFNRWTRFLTINRATILLERDSHRRMKLVDSISKIARAGILIASPPRSRLGAGSCRSTLPATTSSADFEFRTCSLCDSTSVLESSVPIMPTRDSLNGRFRHISVLLYVQGNIFGLCRSWLMFCGCGCPHFCVEEIIAIVRRSDL